MAEKKYQRRLAQRPPENSLPRPAAINCIACNWRRAANDAMKKTIEARPELAGYTGFTYGVNQGALVISQYHLGKQVACVLVPLTTVPEWLDSVADYIAEMAKSVAPAGEVEDDEENEVEETDGEEEEEE